MDSLITAAARALAAGDPLGALEARRPARRSLRRSRCAASPWRSSAISSARRPPASRRARLRSQRGRGRARCVVAEARSRSSRATWLVREGARRRAATLEEHGDRANAAHARHLEVRRLLLIGRLDEAERALAALDPTPFPPAARTAHELVVAGSRCGACGRRRRARRSLGPSGRDSPAFRRSRRRSKAHRSS
jgi:hypothetical protein